jgi:hypothetical protein
VFARVILLLVIAVGFVAGQAAPLLDCAQRVCVCCDAAGNCCAVNETQERNAPVSGAQTTSVDLKVVLVPLIDLLQESGPATVVRVIPALSKPARLPSSARIELTCIRLI